MSKNPLVALLAGEYVNAKAEYARRVGEISIEWNSLHGLMFLWFWHLLGIQKLEPVKKLWECGSGDSFQRNMLRSLSSLIEDEKTKENFIWTINTIDKIGTYRNVLIHTPIKFDINAPQNINVQEIYAKLSHVNTMKRVESKKLYKPLVDDIILLQSYSLHLLGYFIKDEDSLPERPVLKALPELNQEDEKKTHPDTTITPDPLPQSSEE